MIERISNPVYISLKLGAGARDCGRGLHHPLAGPNVHRRAQNSEGKLLVGPNIIANLYCICLSEHETCAYADAVHICGNI